MALEINSDYKTVGAFVVSEGYDHLGRAVSTAAVSTSRSSSISGSASVSAAVPFSQLQIFKRYTTSVPLISSNLSCIQQKQTVTFEGEQYTLVMLQCC